MGTCLANQINHPPADARVLPRVLRAGIDILRDTLSVLFHPSEKEGAGGRKMLQDVSGTDGSNDLANVTLHWNIQEVREHCGLLVLQAAVCFTTLRHMYHYRLSGTVQTPPNMISHDQHEHPIMRVHMLW